MGFETLYGVSGKASSPAHSLYSDSRAEREEAASPRVAATIVPVSDRMLIGQCRTLGEWWRAWCRMVVERLGR
jgi:hypothetical protein